MEHFARSFENDATTSLTTLIQKLLTNRTATVVSGSYLVMNIHRTITRSTHELLRCMHKMQYINSYTGALPSCTGNQQLNWRLKNCNSSLKPSYCFYFFEAELYMNYPSRPNTGLQWSNYSRIILVVPINSTVIEPQNSKSIQQGLCKLISKHTILNRVLTVHNFFKKIIL